VGSALDPLNLFISLMLGSCGVGFFIYGKKQGKPVPLLVGIALTIFPYFVSSPWLMLGIGLVLIVLPALIKI
jgi:hypothetical protein